MTDTLGWRSKFGVVTPSTNTVVQPEYDAMAPLGVTNHLSRIEIPDDPIDDDAGFENLVGLIDAAIGDAVGRLMSCSPDYLILGVSSESIWEGGSAAAERIAGRIRDRVGEIGIAQAAQAIPAALEAHGVSGPVAILTPYMPVAQDHVTNFLEQDCGYEVASVRNLALPGRPTAYASISQTSLREALRDLVDDRATAIVQWGANLPMARLAAEAEGWLDRPVIAVNVATYWYALRQNGINDAIDGFGSLLLRH